MASLRTRIAWLIVVALGLCAAIAVGMGAVAGAPLIVGPDVVVQCR
jgi:hypothetical protein